MERRNVIVHVPRVPLVPFKIFARSLRSLARKERNSLRSFLETEREREDRKGSQAFIFVFFWNGTETLRSGSCGTGTCALIPFQKECAQHWVLVAQTRRSMGLQIWRGKVNIVCSGTVCIDRNHIMWLWVVKCCG